MGQAHPKGANLWDIKPDEHVFLGEDLFRLRLPEVMEDGQPLIVTITLMAEARQRLNFNCTHCFQACEHVGRRVFADPRGKNVLGLAAAPKPRVPVESLDEEEAWSPRPLPNGPSGRKIEKMAVHTADAERPWTDYTVTNRLSGKTYRVALRGLEPGDSYCSCPDFRTNTLGTCKHILHVLNKVKRRFPPRELKRGPIDRKRLAVHLRYEDESDAAAVDCPTERMTTVAKIVAPLAGRPIEDMHDLVKRLTQLQKLGQDVMVYPDAEEFIQQRLVPGPPARRTADIRADPAKHPLRTHAAEDPAVAVSARRRRLCRRRRPGDPGRRHGAGQDHSRRRRGGVAGPRGRNQKVLVVCPASLKSQWRNEIRRFCDRDVQLITGAGRRARPTNTPIDCFFTVCNYEQVLRDILPIEARHLGPDHSRRRPAHQELGIEDQPRHQGPAVARSRSCCRGTPLENRLDDLYSVVQFIDDRRLGPGFRFFNKHRVVDEKGKVLGYKNLAELRRALRADPAAPHARAASSSSCRRARPRSSASRPPTNNSNCTTRTCRSSPASRARSSSARWTCCGCKRRC